MIWVVELTSSNSPYRRRLCRSSITRAPSKPFSTSHLIYAQLSNCAPLMKYLVFGSNNFAKTLVLSIQLQTKMLLSFPIKTQHFLLCVDHGENQHCIMLGGNSLCCWPVNLILVLTKLLACCRDTLGWASMTLELSWLINPAPMANLYGDCLQWKRRHGRCQDGLGLGDRGPLLQLCSGWRLSYCDK